MDNLIMIKKLNEQLEGYLKALDDRTNNSLISENFKFKKLINEIEHNYKQTKL